MDTSQAERGLTSLSTNRSTRLAVPWRSDQKTGADPAGRGRRPRLRMRLPVWWEAAMRAGKVAAALSSSTPPALIPPMSGSTNRSTTGRPRRSPMMSATDRSPLTGAAPRWGITRSLVTRSDSPGLRRPDRASGHHLVGTPRLRAAGIGRSRPRARIDAPVVPTGTSSSRTPICSQSSVASGRRARKASAARSTVRPANSAESSLPPTRLPASRTCTMGGPAPVAMSDEVTNSQAAERPAMPPPTTAMTGRRGAVT